MIYLFIFLMEDDLFLLFLIKRTGRSNFGNTKGVLKKWTKKYFQKSLIIRGGGSR